MKMRYKVLTLFVLLGTEAYLLKHFQHGIIQPNVPHVLPAGDTEQLIINPVTHQLTVVTVNGSHVVTLPDHVSVIDVHHNGTVTVTAPQFGLEARPFVGAFFSNKLRFGAGLDGLYWKKLDLGLGLAGGSGASTVIFAAVSYTIWDNVHIGVTYDHQQHLGIGITVRI